MTLAFNRFEFTDMRQCYHTIIMAQPDGRFVGWVEEIRGTITSGHSLDECRRNLKDSLQLILQSHREEARGPLKAGTAFISEEIEVEVPEYALSGQ